MDSGIFSQAGEFPPINLQRRSRVSIDLLDCVVALIEFALVATISLMVSQIFVERFDDRVIGYLVVTGVAALSVVLSFYGLGLYSLRALSTPNNQLPRIVVVFLILLLTVSTTFFALKVSDEFSRRWLFGWILLSITSISLFRYLLAQVLRTLAERGDLTRDVVILGADNKGRKLLAELKRSNDPWINVVGFFDDRTSRYESTIDGIPLLGQTGDLVRVLREYPGLEVLITLPWSAKDRLGKITQELRLLPVNVNLIPDLFNIDFNKVSFERLGDKPILRISRKPIAGWRWVFKHFEDWVIGGTAFVLLSPVMLAIMLAVKLTSPGPIFFRQNRYGFNHKLIGVYKFRTMYAHLTDANAERLAKRGDERITPLGAFLRRTSLDELPQLLNVLKGEMSLVGPRPHATQAKAADRLYDDVVDEYGRAPSGEARHHRLGSGQWLARRYGYLRKNHQARRARSLLHRELLTLARHQDPRDDLARLHQGR